MTLSITTTMLGFQINPFKFFCLIQIFVTIMKKMYLIGNVSDITAVDLTVRRKHFFVQTELTKLGFDVFNPIGNPKNDEKGLYDKMRSNLTNLLNSGSVYVMPDVDIQTNLELKIANNLGLIVFQSLIYIPTNIHLSY